jgi:ABC-2 type transport system ATP-binding protein
LAYINVDSVTIKYHLHNPYSMNLKRTVSSLFSNRSSYHNTITALKDLSLDLTSGSRIGLIGENGAGKTTLLKVLSGGLPPTKGNVKIDGKVLSFLGSPIHGLDSEMTGYENIEYLSVINKEKVKKGSSLFNSITEFTGLKERLADPVFTYSSGMKARLRFSILTSFSPDILLLDEGIGAADFAFSLQAKIRLQEFLGRAGILVLASHSPDFLNQFCTTGLWLTQGELSQIGSLEDTYASYVEAIRARENL